MPRICLIPMFIAFSCASCRDNPKLVEQREKQKSEITSLKGELALIEEKLKDIPPNVSEALAKAEKQEEEQSAEVTRLEAEVSELEARKRSLQTEFDTYRAKYHNK